MLRNLILFSLFPLTQAVYAHALTCPSINAIRTVGIEEVASHGSWGGYILRNNFDTNVDWAFTVYGFSAKDEFDAFKQANDAIGKLKLNDDLSKPEQGACVYMSDNPELTGVAISPSPIPPR